MPATSNVYLTLETDMFKERPSISDFDPNPASAYGTNSENAIGAIEVLDFSFAIKQIVPKDEDGRYGLVERVERGDLQIEKAVDSRSPKLFIFCCKAEMISEANLMIFGPRHDKAYLTFKMKGVRVAEYKAKGGGKLATEDISLRFDQMQVKFDNAGIGTARHGNTRAGTVEYTWNWTTEVPGFSALPPGYV